MFQDDECSRPYFNPPPCDVTYAEERGVAFDLPLAVQTVAFLAPTLYLIRSVLRICRGGVPWTVESYQLLCLTFGKYHPPKLEMDRGS